MSINEKEYCKKFKAHIHFSGCGGLYNYFAGIADIIQKNYIIDYTILFSGASGGCIIAGLLLLNINIKDYFFYNYNKNLLHETNKNLFGALFCFIDKFNKYNNLFLNDLGKDTYKKFNNNYLIFLNEYNTETKKYENRTIKEWNNNNDLSECICTSCHIKYFRKKNNRTTNIKYKDGLYCDLKGKYIPIVEEMCETIPTLNFYPERWRKINKN